MRRDFTFVAVEADWPDCYGVNCSVTGARGAPGDPRSVLAGFHRWPTWMWSNEQVAEFTRWLLHHNVALPADERVGFYGLDVYSLWDSLRRIMDYLKVHQPDHLETALQAWRCFESYAEDPQRYARSLRIVPTGCAEEVVGILAELRAQQPTPAGDHADARFDAEQNARAAAGAEGFYRAMIGGGPDSWNIRDCHMADTLDRLLQYRSAPGRPAKAVVWEHNTHVGDARFTDMADAGMVNVGQLARRPCSSFRRINRGG